jgi:cation:H+ antiporter
LLWALALDGAIGGLDGALLFGLIVAYTAFLVVQSRRQSRSTREERRGG